VKQIVLLRGINVGGRNRVAMPELREALTDAGMSDVRTYVQSGNLVLDSSSSPAALAQECERAIAERFGLDVAVVVRTRSQLAKAIERDPFGELADNPKLYQVIFCSRKPGKAAVEKVAERAAGDERLVVHGREIYAWFPDGVGRSRLAAQLGGRALGVTVTARNWTTVAKLLEIADS
jgi:uncharacterized protein (DUF1697 family)